MPWPWLFRSGRAIDLILVFMVLEFAVLCWRRRDQGRAAIDVLIALAPGGLLMLAVRAALTGAGWMWIAGLLAASLPAHLMDLSRRRL
jgi:hypothetical protein